jgi:hypothetical protein
MNSAALKARGWRQDWVVHVPALLEALLALDAGQRSGPGSRTRLAGVLWTSEAPSVQAVREEGLMTVYRAAYIQQHGLAITLQEMLAQEGYAMAVAGCTRLAITSDDVNCTRQVITPHLKARDRPTLMACLVGDAAARSLGYRPLGLSERAGLALALHDARLKLSRSS